MNRHLVPWCLGLFFATPSAGELPAQVVLEPANDGEEIFALEFPGTGRLHVWAASSSADPRLSIATVDSSGRFVEHEDDDGGGDTTAYLELEGERDQGLEVRVWIDGPESRHEVELHASWALESETSLALAEGLLFDLAAISPDTADAPRRTAELAENLPAEVSLMSPAILRVAEQFAALPRRARGGRVELNARELLHEYASTHLPPHHPERLQAAARFAVALKENGRVAEARDLELEVLRGFQATLPPEDPQVQFARMNLAGSHFLLDDLDRAVIEYRAVLTAAERAPSPNVALLSMTRQNLAAVELELGYAGRAAETYAAEIEFLERAPAADESALAAVRANHGRALVALGRPEEAEQVFLAALPVLRANLPAPDPVRVGCELAYGGTLGQLGDPQGARLIYERVLADQLAARDASHPEVLVTRRLLAEVLFQQGDFAGARSLYDDIVAAHAQLADHATLESLLARLHLAETRREQGELEAALAGFESVLAELPEGLSSTHPLRIAAQVDLAALLTTAGDLERAGPMQASVLARLLTVLPETDPDVQRARDNLAWTRVRQGRHAETGDLLRASIRALGERVARVGRERSPREVEGIVERSRRDLDELASLVACLPSGEARSELAGQLFELVESVRSIALVHRRAQRRIGSLEESAALRRARTDLAAAEAELVRRSRTGGEEFFAAVVARDAAEAALQAAWLERDSSLRLDPLRARDAADGLQPHEAWVGFWRYECKRVDGESLRLSAPVPHYLAHVVRPSGLHRVELGPAQVVDDAIARWRTAILGGTSTAERGVALAGEPLVPDDGELAAGSELRALVVDPLREALGEATEIACARDDALFLVPFDALPEAGAGGRVLGDTLRFTYRTSLRAPAPAAEVAVPVLLAMGGVDYDRAAAPAEGEGNGESDPRSGRRPADAAAGIERLRDSRVEFEYLPGSAREVRDLVATFGRSHPGATSTVLSGVEADRRAFETLGAGCTYLHLATHAYVAPESVPSTRDATQATSTASFDRREQVRGFAPMLLSGLAFAGANTAAAEGSGVLTAQELAALDLSSCRLAVLSACETHLGVRRAGQGVASLQTALHAAGVRASITSLWKVPDEATRALMTAFYSALWEEGLPAARALWSAKEAVREHSDDRGRPRYATRDWAAWVLVGEP